MRPLSATLKGYLFAAPLLAVLSAAVLLPALYNAALAFWRYDAMRNAWRFAGLSNFVALMDAPAFWNAVTVTAIWVIGNVSLQLALGMAVALALNTVTRLRAFYNGVVMVPWVSSFVVVAIVFLWLYHPELGVLNDLLLRLKLVEQPIAWLGYPGLAQMLAHPRQYLEVLSARDNHPVHGPADDPQGARRGCPDRRRDPPPDVALRNSADAGALDRHGGPAARRSGPSTPSRSPSS